MFKTESRFMKVFSKICDMVLLGAIFLVSCVPVITIGAASTALYYTTVKVDYIKKCNFEKVWLVGDQFAAAQHSFKTYANAGEVIEEIKNKEPNGYTILIKGSNGIKLNTVVDYL